MNCVFIVIDSLDYTRYQQSRVNLLPFLSKISENGLICENMYSQAPYTEAAAMALYCGQNTLDNHGYIERYNNASKTIFELMSENGYDVYFNAFQPQCYPSSLRRGITDIRYNRGFDFIGFWNYRLSYYSELYDKGKLIHKDYLQLIRLFDDNLKEWEIFLDDISNDDISVRMIKNRNKLFNAEREKEKLDYEIKLYMNNKEKYIKSVFESKKGHNLFKIKPFIQKDFEFSNEVLKIFKADGKKICSEIRKKNFISNLFFNADIYKEAFDVFIQYKKTKDKSGIRLMKNVLFSPWVKNGAGEKIAGIKEQPSFRTHIEDFLEWLDKRNDEKPYFACIHVDDIHYPEAFYTYDTNNLELLKEEYDLVKAYLRKRKISEPGCISTDLSLLYADFQCKYLVDQMKARRKYTNTVFFVTADHGFSYAGYPIRNKPINTFYLENYKIPFFAFGTKMKVNYNEELHSSVDIPKTICSFMGIDSGNAIEGINVFDKGRDALIIEYCGGGCPDLLRRKIMIASFDKNKMFSCKIKLDDEFSIDHVSEVYDLKDDPFQKNNLADNYVKSEYLKLIQNVENRFNDIKNDERYFWESLFK